VISGEPCEDLEDCCDELSGDEEDACEDIERSDDAAACMTGLATYCP
jgi:hypothetical protein